MKIFSYLRQTLKDYCSYSSLAGLRYIADSRYHYTERLFWLACVILSWIGSAFLILNYMNTYINNSVSMVVKSISPTDILTFPSVGVCEMGYTKEEYHELDELILDMMDPSMSLEEKRDNYNYDIEDFLMRVIFHNLYNYGSMSSYCTPYIGVDDVLQCPMKNYQQYADRVRANCSKLFTHCEWNRRSFPCCDYFQPVRTTLGTCYLLNSLQKIDKSSKKWLDMSVGMRLGTGHLNLTVTKSSALYILNEEDIPHMLLTTLQFPQIPDGYDGELLLSIQDIINDPYVRNIEPELRKCKFPDEESNSAYRKYSYSTCVTECLKQAQIKICNCTHYNLIVDDKDRSEECDFYGLGCLDKNDLLFPQTTILQPWRKDGLQCRCLPSCNEPQINVVRHSSKIREYTRNRSVSIRLQSLPTQRYYRQAVREKIDIVVSVGGILGLFMGASILSLAELIYFFIVRRITH